MLIFYVSKVLPLVSLEPTLGKTKEKEHTIIITKGIRYGMRMSPPRRAPVLPLYTISTGPSTSSPSAPTRSSRATFKQKSR
ncbi:hypothetical protein HanPSC8_Chr08g0331251 [Helianthus annuus]|nr:hypothetical protein HanPSC8_Chr08g0331251 [Helianthus annuus]